MNITDFMSRIAADTYPEPRSGGHDSITEQMAPRFASLIPPGCKVLDVGCGHGPALEWFQSHGYIPLGIALNPEDVRACHERGLPVLEMDQNAMTFASGQFGAVWARHVLEHSVAPYWTLTEFARVLAPGGWLYVEVPAPDTACQHETNQNHYSVMGVRMWMSLIRRAGFEIHESLSLSLQTQAGPDIYFNFICQKQ